MHEVGLFIAWPSHHKHDAYVLAHADLPGFSRPEQEVLAALVLGHRGKLDPERFKALAPHPPPDLDRLMVLLRLSCRLHRSRSARPVPETRFAVEGNSLSLNFQEGALADRPLTRADLEEEAEMLKAASWSLGHWLDEQRGVRELIGTTRIVLCEHPKLHPGLWGYSRQRREIDEGGTRLYTGALQWGRVDWLGGIPVDTVRTVAQRRFRTEVGCARGF